MQDYTDNKTQYLELNHIMIGGTKINEFKKQFVSFVSKIDAFHIILEPYLEKIVNDRYVKYNFKNNRNLSKLFISRIEKDYKKIISNIFNIKKYKYNYDKLKNHVIISFKPSESDFKNVFQDYKFKFKKEYNMNDIIGLYNNYFSDLVESGPDTWLAGNIMYISKNEVDEYNYTINVKLIKINHETGGKIDMDNKSRPKLRPSPSISATLFDLNTKKKGNDGNMWIIKMNKNGVKKWSKINKVFN
jgi:hypothetical protein